MALDCLNPQQMNTFGQHHLLVLQVKYAADKRSVMVTTKVTAPGGARTEKVGLPFDPDLFDHMVEHGVVVEVTSGLGSYKLHTHTVLAVCMLAANRSIGKAAKLTAACKVASSYVCMLYE